MDFQLVDRNKTQAGDIFLCYSSAMIDKVEGIENGYSHVALCLRSNNAIESSASGVKRTTLDGLLAEYEHIAVLRNNEFWDDERIKKLDSFANDNIGKKFNSKGMKEYNEVKKSNGKTIMDQIRGVSDENITPVSSDRNTYFCSELIMSIFIHVGIIGKTATVIFRPETFSPEDIGRDKIFGLFIGYIFSYDEYEIPINDVFRSVI